MAITERVILPVNGSVDEWKDALTFMIQIISIQDGHLRTRYGFHTEDKQKIELLIGWESIEAPKKFQSSPAFQEMLSHIRPVLAAPPNILIIEFKPYAPAEVVDAPFIQMITIQQYTSSEDDLRDQITKFKDFQGCTGIASGFSLDDVDGKEKAFVAAVGWDDLEASEMATESMTGFLDGAESHLVDFKWGFE
ncbi:08dc36b4-9857-4787-bf69-2ddf8bc804b9 [Sclerotinia trifoliorum]|uniref:08dc36b4-9857-4787-bf69-2ddf8bc804b9 n=1 Tax=Sclerotinia trifoliorum TaxID=28548 RepID=A0A8H2VP91_9HELO|nr:08dc36b4-9857-4787-bf69-2ddf8bc804b9 [Sclerotinia trifoliorum]